MYILDVIKVLKIIHVGGIPIERLMLLLTIKFRGSSQAMLYFMLIFIRISQSSLSMIDYILPDHYTEMVI